MKFTVPILCFLLSAFAVSAATNTATDCSLAAVQAAVDASSAGDTVQVPSGSTGWTGTLSIGIDIQLIGAGQGVTIISNSVPSGVNNGTMVIWGCSAGGSCRISGFTFIGGASEGVSGTGQPSFYLSGDCHAFRVDNCDFVRISRLRVFELHGWIYGVVDHCNFYTYETVFLVHADSYGGHSYGDGSWADSDLWGTTNAFYIETCNFTSLSSSSGIIDAIDGARIVLRNCNLTNSNIGTHGTESSGRARGVRLLEIYNNQFYASGYPTAGFPLEEGIYLRSGTMTVFSNLFQGEFKYMIKSSLYRKDIHCFSIWCNISGANGWDSNSPTLYTGGTASSATWVSGTSSVVDTSKTWTANQWQGYWIYGPSEGLGAPISGNTTNEIMYPNLDAYGGPSFFINTGESYEVRLPLAAIDQPGSGQGDLLSGDTPTPVWLNDAVNPVYEWGNTWNWTLGGLYATAKLAQDGGTLLNNLYQSDVARPGYVPLVYPHPLVMPDTNPPSIFGQPLSQTNAVGSNVTFSVTASGSAPLLYQWYKTNPLSAATSSSYTITGLVLTNAGGFYVTITNDFGSVTSSVATLTVTNTVSGGGSPPPGNTNAITLHFGTINAVHVGQ